jgi:hypothetical protein
MPAPRNASRRFLVGRYYEHGDYLGTASRDGLLLAWRGGLIDILLADARRVRHRIWVDNNIERLEGFA